MKQLTQPRVIASWATVCLPLAWGAYATLQRALALFT
jgi:hypothetical protein